MTRSTRIFVAIFAAFGMLSLPVMASANTIDNAINVIGISGQYVGTHEGSAGGIGVNAGATFGQFFTTANVQDVFSGAPASNQGTDGQFWTMNVDGGYLFKIANDFQVGPYLGFNRMSYSRTYGPQSLSASDNNLGGGVYAAWSPVHRLTLLAHVGGYGAFGASAHIAGYSIQAYNSNLVQAAFKTDYRFTRHFHAFAGFDYDDYTGAYGLPVYNGSVGIAYTY